MKQKIHASSLFFTLILFALTLYTGCRLNNDDDIEANKSCVGCQTNNGEHLFIRSSNSSNGTDRDGDENEIGNRKIQLGRKRANPFSTTAMTQAWNTLWPNQSVTAIPASHLYVRFKPTSLEEYKLLEPSDIPLTTFPLDYEIIQHGDWYDDPAIPNDQIPWFYSVVPANFQFPAVPYDILESLVLAPMKSELTRRSFLLQSQSSDAVTYRDGCTPECESWPECTEAEHEEGCDVIINGGGGGSHNPPPSPNNPPNDALGDPYNPNLAIPGEVYLNACGCPITSEPRNPGGCIKVVDTQLPANATVAGKEVHLAGVAQVQVTWWNGWFGFSTTHTNNNGCWQIDDIKDYGKGWMWVKFKNDRAVIRGLRDEKAWEYAFAVTDAIGEISGPTFNNISVIYTATGGDGSASKLFWYAATGNNALADYHGYASAEGIAVPPMDLDILLLNQSGSAAAPMFNKSGMNWTLFFGIQPLLGGIMGIPILATLTPLLELIGLIATIWAPDVVYLYGDEGMVSDRVKETFYHEFGHAAHFNALHNDGYWHDEVMYTIGNYLTNNNSPYGTRGTPGFEQAAIVESWGYYIGPAFSDKEYGLFHSRISSGPPAPLPIAIESRRWKFAEESFVPDVASAGGSLDNFIPKGLCLDLIDNNALNPPGLTDGVTDPILGFTPRNYFDAIATGSPTTLLEVEGNLSTSLPSGVTAPMLRAMMAAYGY